MKKDIYQVVTEVGQLATLAAIRQEIQETVSDPLSSIDDLSFVIQQDANISARLLRIANSSFYGSPNTIDTISEAISLIGTFYLHDLVSATMVVDFFKDLSPDFVDMESFWKHSVGCAIAARTLADSCQRTNPERCFIAGLLHDIGRLVIYLQLPGAAREIFRLHSETGRPMLELEIEVLGFDHARLGGELLRFWNFPVTLVEAVEFHHDPRVGPDSPPESSVVNVADTIAHALEMGNSGDLGVPPFQLKAWNRLGVSPAILTPAFMEIEKQLNDLLRMLIYN